MPIRIIGYDGASYRDQLYSVKDKNGNYYRNKNKRYPVVTLVLYFGLKHWNKAKSLYENIGEIDKEMLPWVQDYHINLFEIAWLSEEQVGKFKSDFKVVAEYFAKMRKEEEYTGTKEELLHVKETLQLLSYLTKDDRFIKIYEESRKEGEVIKNMSEALNKIQEKERAEGKDEERYRVAEDMLRENEPIEKIRKYSQLADNAIVELAKKIGVAVFM